MPLLRRTRRPADPVARADAAGQSAAAGRPPGRARAALPAEPGLLPDLLAGPDHRVDPARGAVPRVRLLLVVLRDDAGKLRGAGGPPDPGSTARGPAPRGGGRQQRRLPAPVLPAPGRA